MTSPLKEEYTYCPLCRSTAFDQLVTAPCTQHPLYQDVFPVQLVWMGCQSCGHIFTDTYYTQTGLDLLFSRYNEDQVSGGDIHLQRKIWAPVVDRVLQFLPSREAVWKRDVFWMDIGCGDGSLVYLAHEYGFKSFGVDTRAEAIQGIKSLGYQGFVGDLNNIEIDHPVDVISLADVLEHVSFPVAALNRVHNLLKPDGLLFISCPNLDCVSWRVLDKEGANPYWSELEHHHNFSRASLTFLLQSCGFEAMSYGVSTRYKACMELIALKQP